MQAKIEYSGSSRTVRRAGRTCGCPAVCEVGNARPVKVVDNLHRTFPSRLLEKPHPAQECSCHGAISLMTTQYQSNYLDDSPDLHSNLLLYGIPVQGLINLHAELRLRPPVPSSVRRCLRVLETSMPISVK